MSIIANNLLQGDDGYNIARSLRLRSLASAYLNRTISIDGSLRKGTFSFWIKRANNRTDGEPDNIYQSANTGDNNYRAFINLGTNGGTASLQIYAYDNAGNLVLNIATSAVYRDPSSWYHIVFSFDTTQTTSSDRAKVYINGVQQTSLSSSTYPSQNTDLGYFKNLTSGIYIGANRGGASPYASCYLTEYNVIDGQALTPSSFGETDLVTGVWKAKKYAGTYGTNGFYLPFSDNSSTTTLGYDKSGNSNNWTCNNISLTAGATYDSMTDVPTLTSASASNFCVLNPLNRAYSTYTLSDGNLNWTSGTVNQGAFGTIQLPNSGKYYWEVVMTANAGGNPMIGIGGGVDVIGAIGITYRTNGNKEQYGAVSGNGTSAYGATWTTNDVIGIAYDADTSGGQITFYKNNSSQGVAFTGLTANFPNGLFAGFQNNATGTTTFQTNFGQRPFAYTPPTGFVALNTFNLPEPSIKQGNKHFDATTYTGNNTTNVITNSGSMQPDLVWIKSRSTAANHALMDVIRGVSWQLQSSTTNAESQNSAGKGLQSFNSNGFTLGQESDAVGGTNANGASYVGWQWKANGTGSSNTAGSITSTVSANPTAGFSVVTYTGTGANATVGHGLGVAPKMVIVKSRSAAGTFWPVYHASIGAGNYLALNYTDAQTASSAIWNSTNPTSSVFSISTSSNINGSGSTYVAYCFSEVAGYSKFGSYTGNLSADGPFVHLGFRPKFLMVKNSGGTQDWTMVDSSRSTYNITYNDLYANQSLAEQTDQLFDFLSNGFKVRGANNATNASGSTIIYMAFAENPFKYSLAR